jgi:hypothetical protein
MNEISMHAKGPAHRIVLDFITLIMFGEEFHFLCLLFLNASPELALAVVKRFRK